MRHPTRRSTAGVPRFLADPLPLTFAHRGGMAMPGNVGIENTLAAFARAVDMGYRHLETDVHATADGVAVLVHDAELTRVTAGHRTDVVSQLSWAALSRVRVGGTEPFARLDELLDTFPDALVNVDVKDDAAVGPFLAALRRTGAADRVGVAAFGTARALRLRRALGSDVAVSATPVEVAGWLSRSVLPVTGPRSPRVSYQVPEQIGGRQVVTARTVAAAHRLGRQVHVWTVDDPARMHALLDAGVDGLITDRPDVLRDVLVSRGSWQRWQS